MTEITKKSDYKNLLDRVSMLIEEARRKAVTQVNTLIVQTYWAVGGLIVDDEQEGREKADYGTALIAELSKDLTKRYGKGFSKSNLFLMRKFYLTYPPQKFQTVSGKFKSGQILSWSHYCELITIKEEHARSFYEIESINNKWSVRELKRQINALLFERLALSKDKERVMQLAQKGQGMCLAAQPRPHHLETVESLLRPRCQHCHNPLMN